MIIVKAPAPFVNSPRPWVFLSGSIEQGEAEQWQTRVEADLADLPGTILNPRRDDWDASWVQSIGNLQFRQQVEWELEGLERADLIAIYFSPTTKSPITLLELGLAVASRADVAVCCPSGFWRRGNVEVVCMRYGPPLVESLEDLVAWLHQAIQAWARKCGDTVADLPDLTPRQKQIYRDLVSCFRQVGYLPTIRVLARWSGLSPSTVSGHLQALARKGYLRSAGRRGYLPMRRG
jgi:DNA-binding transcriptional ArsR family regulator